ncbi:hypothetical protein [Nocardioides sp.]|uniref:rolling circle replication-associated protein n=1 Tax=Nocardioides sp. TaxID=35761 RepID=UPI0026077BAA|nr:hypothetical protein [Nocardioides sp.]
MNASVLTPTLTLPSIVRFPSTELVGLAAALYGRYEGVERQIRVRERLQVEYVDGREISFPQADFVERLKAEGPIHRVEVAPGYVAVKATDPVRAIRTYERQAVATAKAEAVRTLIERRAEVEACEASRCGCGGAEPDCFGREMARAALAFLDHEGVSRLHSWSAKSRARMTEKIGRLDVSPMFDEGGTPALITLTLPGDWLAVTPSAKVWQNQIQKLRRRFRDKWGHSMVGFWKREFQARGAPHWHMMGWVPNDPGFRAWLSETWADIVDAPWCGHVFPARMCRLSDRREVIVCCDYHRHLEAGAGVDYYEGVRASDPRRMAIYFGKHSSFADKEYQNQAPREWVHDPACEDDLCEGCSVSGVGRFWGVWGLQDAARASQIPPDLADAMVQIMRRWAHTKRYAVPTTVWRKRYSTRVDTSTGEITETWRWRKRRSTAVVKRLAGGQRSGWLLVNDGPGLASQLQRAALQAVWTPQRGGRSGAGPIGFLP